MTNVSAEINGPVVSVVMIAYNKEAYIADAIKGVVKQRFDAPFELLVLDDCSTDSTAAIIREWQGRYPEVVRYIRNERNLGLQRNYLEAFRHCRGRYMAICDADDYWCYRGKLKCMVRYMDTHPDCAISFHRVINYYEASGEKSFSNPATPADTTMNELSRSNYITNLSVMYRRGLVDLTRLPGWIAFDRSPDYAMHALYARHGYIHFFKRPMGVYRKTAGSAWSMTERYRQLKMSLTVRQRLVEEFDGNEAVCEGLTDSIRAIVKSMSACAATAGECAEAMELCSDYGVEPTAGVTEKPRQKSVLSRLWRSLSRLMPLPRP